MNLFLSLLLLSFGAQAQVSFPDNYEDSRARFRSNCEQRRAANIKWICQSFVLANKANADLTVDYAYLLRSQSKKLLIVVSGNHGPEGYSGATAQELLMKSYVPALEEAGIDVVLIHALNPFGYKFNQRTDEDNVNLNRNFGTEEKMFAEENANYERFREVLEPHEYVTSSTSFLLRLKLIWELIKSGFNTKDFAQGMNAGQYQSQPGLSFGGFKFQPQVQFVENLLKPILPQYQEILFLDMHTGLGEKNTLHIMPAENISDYALKRSQDIFDFDSVKDQIQFTSGRDKGFYTTKGGLIEFILALTSEKANVMSFVFEFGTVGKNILAQMNSAILLILQNQARHYKCQDPALCEKIQQDFTEHFNPSSEEWRKQYLAKMHEVFRRIASRF